MDARIPTEARPVARVLLIDPKERLLLLEAEHESGRYTFWVAPGGGLEGGESFEEAARRELHEETGLDLPIGSWVWTRRHAYSWAGQSFDQYERFFVARTETTHIAPNKADAYVVGHRWWTVSELRDSGEQFAPRRLAELLPDIICSNYPKLPIDCGI